MLSGIFITVAGGVTVALLVFLANRVYNYLHDNKEGLKTRYEAMMRRFFYSERIVKELIFSFNSDKVRDNDFIHYSTVLNGRIYKELGLRFKVKMNNRERVFDLPYTECINFIRHPKTVLRLTDTRQIPVITLDEHLMQDTDSNIKEYMTRNPNAYNQRILCLKELHQTSTAEYACTIAQTDFTDVVRTKLTLDYPLAGHFGETLRRREMAAAGGGLPALHDSILMNSIGVSAIWCMDSGAQKTSDRYVYYLKCRQAMISVYPDMLGTTSGYVNPPAEGCFTSDNLLEFIKAEMLREFDEETGFKGYADAKGFRIEDEKLVKIIPLALTRELIRGGCPQFFFLIVTPYITDKEFVNYFKKSIDGRNEFRDDNLSNLKSHPLSPETLTNLLYCQQYLQRAENLDFIYL